MILAYRIVQVGLIFHVAFGIYCAFKKKNRQQIPKILGISAISFVMIFFVRFMITDTKNNNQVTADLTSSLHMQFFNLDTDAQTIVIPCITTTEPKLAFDYHLNYKKTPQGYRVVFGDHIITAENFSQFIPGKCGN